MNGTLMVGLGGFLGAIARYRLGASMLHWVGDARLLSGTFVVNVLGCLVAGLLAGLAGRYHLLGPDARLFLFTGLLGGFTTFSAFGLETMGLLRRGELGVAALYAGGSVILGLAAVWLGLKVFDLIPR